MITVIAGSRNIPLVVFDIVMAQYYTDCISEVVSGTAKGVDTFGELWAKDNNIPIKRMPANWARWGRFAGFYRNVDMGEYCDQAIIVWDGSSKGTLHMIDIMKRLNKPYYLDIINEEVARRRPCS